MKSNKKRGPGAPKLLTPHQDSTAAKLMKMGDSVNNFTYAELGQMFGVSERVICYNINRWMKGTKPGRLALLVQRCTNISDKPREGSVGEKLLLMGVDEVKLFTREQLAEMLGVSTTALQNGIARWLPEAIRNRKK